MITYNDYVWLSYNVWQEWYHTSYWSFDEITCNFLQSHQEQGKQSSPGPSRRGRQSLLVTPDTPVARKLVRYPTPRRPSPFNDLEMPKTPKTAKRARIVYVKNRGTDTEVLDTRNQETQTDWENDVVVTRRSIRLIAKNLM